MQFTRTTSSKDDFQKDHVVDNSIKAKIEVGKDIFLYTYKNRRHDDKFLIFYEIECARYCSGLYFSLDFTGSDNLNLNSLSDYEYNSSEAHASSSPCLEVTVPPFQRKKIGYVSLLDKSRRAILKYKYSWKLCPVVQHQDMILKAEQIESRLKQVVSSAASILPIATSHYNQQTATEYQQSIRHIFSKNKSQAITSYIDLAFAPVETSLKQAVAGSLEIETVFPVVWNRPRDFLNDSYKVFTDGIHAADIRQGYLADCWLLSAVAALAEFPALIEELFPRESKDLNDFGYYEVRLCVTGLWVIVSLDDYFPCFPVDRGGPVYSQSHGSELWVLLLEKAFAKMRGSYGNLRYGSSLDAMIDLTGAPFSLINLQVLDDGAEASSLWDQILEYDQWGYVMAASTAGLDERSEGPGRGSGGGVGASSDDGASQGLVLGHAYTVISARATSTGVRLLQLRNPWGMFEWTGDWSDESPLWTPALLDELNYSLDIDDGTFWMSFSDFFQLFSSLEVCMVRQPQLHQPWNEQRRKIWVSLAEAESEVRLQNLDIPLRLSSMFILQVSANSPTLVYFSAHQPSKVRSQEGGARYIDIGVTVLKIKPNGTFEFVCSSGLSVERQMQTLAVLDRGVYVVITMTSGTKLKQYQLQRDIRDGKRRQSSGGDGTVDEVRLQKVKFFDEKENKFSKKVSYVLDEIFSRLDSDNNGILRKEELDLFLQITNDGAAVEDTVFRWFMQTFESRDGGITLNGFKQAQMYMYKASGCDDREILKDFLFMGYNEELELIDTENITLACHSESTDILLKQIDFDRSAFDEAFEVQSRSREGESKDLCDGELKIYICEAGVNSNGVSLAVDNCGKKRLHVELDCSNSVNTISHRGSLIFSDYISPGECVLFHLLFPLSLAEDWVWNYAANVIDD